MRAGSFQPGIIAWRARRGVPPLRVRLAFLLLLLAVLSVLGGWVTDLALREPLARWAESRAINIGTRAISLAISENLAHRIRSEDLVVRITDGQGRLAGVSFVLGEINRIEAEAAFHIQQALNVLREERLGLPLGQLTGLDWLSGFGPALWVRIVPVGSLRTAVKTEFRAAGINQVLHRIYVDVEVDMKVVAPLLQKELPLRQQVPLVEEVYIGEVPQVYLNLGPVDVGGLRDGQLLWRGP